MIVHRSTILQEKYPRLYMLLLALWLESSVSVTLMLCTRGLIFQARLK